MIVIYSPSCDGAIFHYSNELFVEIKKQRDTRLLTTGSIEPSTPQGTIFLCSRIKQRKDYSNRISWSLGRAGYYLGRELALYYFLVRNRRSISRFHAQEAFYPFLPFLTLLLRLFSIRCFFTVHNVRQHDYSSRFRNALCDRVTHRCLKYWHALIVHGKTTANELQQIIPSTRIQIIPHPIFSEFATREVRPGEPSAKRLLIFGSIRRNKGIELAIQALTFLPNYHLEVCGYTADNSYIAQISAEALRSGVTNRVTITNQFVPDSSIPEIFSRASIVLLPYTNFAAQSGVLSVAIAYGRPVVVSNVGDMPEIVNSFKCGLVAAADTAAGIAEAVISMAQNNTYSACVDGTRIARNDLCMENICRKTVEAYDTL